MIRHAAQGLPWGVLAAGTATLAVLLALVHRWPGMNWPLQGIAVGTAAATAVWCFDEPLAAVVDTTPRHLAWRTMARSVGVAALLTTWVLLVAITHHAYFEHAVAVAWQGVVAVFTASCYVTWRRSRGTATPARAAAAPLVGVAAFVALARPFEHGFPLFPFIDEADWAASYALWLGTTVAGLAFLVASLSGSIRPHGNVSVRAR